VEHPCHQCGTPVEDGVAFCRHCNAPQIRVKIGEVPLELVPAAPHDSELIASPIPPVAINPSAIQWSQALPAATLAGLIAALSMMVPLGFLGIGTVAAGAIAVVVYHRRRPATLLTPAIGAKVGVLSGGIGFVIFALIMAVEVTVFRGGAQLRDALLQAVEQSAARAADPQAQVLVDWMKSPEGLAVMMGLILFVTLVIFLILSSIGGALGATFIRNREGR